MLDRTYDGQVCSVARALEVVGERWTLLILRDAVLGARRFDEFRDRLGIATNVLTARLEWLVDEGLLERRRYQERPERFEYALTPKGRDLAPVLVMLMKWGDRHYPTPGGVPMLTLHRECGGRVDRRMRCGRCTEHVNFDELEITAGPGLKAAGLEPFASGLRASR
jgi:DNA-binding HxlR family transcriptional regulator